jgi:TetR/AcrR family transcriptional regulator
MPKKQRISLRDLEQETEKFLAPATEKEKAIMEAAAELFGKRGIDGATTAEIAKRAGVTEKTLFRYFPSKQDLIRRVLFPHLLRGALARDLERLESLLRTENPDLKSWYVTYTSQRLAAVGKNPGLVRTLLMELAQNDELRSAIAPLWREHVWKPMVERLRAWQASGAIRPEIDVEVIAKILHYFNGGFFFERHVFAPDRKWDEQAELKKLAEILAHGCTPAPPRD